MVIKRIFLSLLLISLSAPGLRAEPLTLGETLARARAQALDVAAAEARSGAAEARAREAKGYRLPQVRLSETWIRTDAPADAFGLLLSQERFSFPEFTQSDPNSPDALETAITRLEVEVPIWTGGEISTRVEQARLAAEAASASAERASDGAALAAAEAWLGLAQAREYVALLERARETVAAHVELARRYVEEGFAVRSELLRAEVELARVEDLLTEARGGARVAESNLAFRLGEALDSTYEIGVLPSPEALSGELGGWLATALDRDDLRSARGMLAAGELEAKARAAGRWPRIGATARHDWTDDTLFGGHGSATSIFVGATFDLFDGGRRNASVAAARAEADAGRRDVERFSSGVLLETRQAYEAATTALERRATALGALDSAAEGLRVVEERFRAGVVKTLDVLDAATARREAETRELVARAEAHAALLRLAVAAGRSPESVLPASTPTGDPS